MEILNSRIEMCFFFPEVCCKTQISGMDNDGMSRSQEYKTVQCSRTITEVKHLELNQFSDG